MVAAVALLSLVVIAVKPERLGRHIFGHSVADAPSANQSGGGGEEQVLAGQQAPYLIVDVEKGRIAVMLASVVLREYEFAILSDSESTGEFVRDWTGRRSRFQIVERVHLLSAANGIPERELEIIAEETRAGVAEIQRHIPHRLVLVTSEGSRIYVETDCTGAKTILGERLKELYRRVWHALFGGGSWRIHLSADDALSLYGVCRSNPRITVRS